MKKERVVTEVVCILDRSGSMGGLESDKIGGYNGFIRKQAEVSGEVRVTTILFDDTYEVIHDGVPADKAILSDKEYFVRGTTALYDAVGKTILSVRNRIAEETAKVIFVIITDGYENSSVEFNAQVVQYMITEQKEVHQWELLFFGANIAVERVGSELGIAQEDAYEFKAFGEGVREMLFVMESSVCKLRSK